MTSEQLTTLILLLEQNPQLNDLIPEADPDIDIKRVGPMLERINTLDKFIDAFKTLNPKPYTLKHKKPP
jgi:hypothetical protein